MNGFSVIFDVDRVLLNVSIVRTIPASAPKMVPHLLSCQTGKSQSRGKLWQ
jgi:hypothetical protein